MRYIISITNNILYSMIIVRSKKRNQTQQDLRHTFESVQQKLKATQQAEDSHDLCKIKKLKNILLSTQKNLTNRIKIMKAESQKIIKKRQNQFKLFKKLQNIKNSYSAFKSLNKTPRKLSKNISSQQLTLNLTRNEKHRSSHQEFEYGNHKAEKIFLQKMQNANRMKQLKQINQEKIKKKKNIELTRKLQSAGMIRRNRSKVKEIKQNVMRSKRQSIANMKTQAYKRERATFFKIQKNIQNLAKQQKFALLNWKKILLQEQNILLS